MRKNVITASLIAGFLFVWLLSGLLFGERGSESHPTLDQLNSNANAVTERPPARVRAKLSQAQPRTRYLALRGRTESKRTVDVKAEISGKVVSRLLERGAVVTRGDVLCELAVDDREASVAEAKAALNDATIEYEGSLKLKEQGLQSQTAIAKASTRLESTRAQLRRMELNLARTRISAPFDGVIEQLQMNVGDYAAPGSICATLIDLDPMLVTADVTEAEVGQLSLGDAVTGTTSTGLQIDGELTFIGKQSDPVTRTYPLEITVANSDYRLRSGLTSTTRIALNEVSAHLVSPALFTLNDAGELGLRTVEEDNRVGFHPVTVIEDSAEGVWVAGLPVTVALITVGQEYVLAGETIDPMFPQSDSARSQQP
jgi:multidrug efflux system membrane fusion protein